MPKGIAIQARFLLRRAVLIHPRMRRLQAQRRRAVQPGGRCGDGEDPGRGPGGGRGGRGRRRRFYGSK